MTSIPLRGLRTRLDTQNPTLIPNMDLVVSSGRGTLDVMDPSDFLSRFPRTAGTVNATLGGTVTTGDTITLTVALGTISGGSASWSYTTVSGDTLETIAEELAAVVNASQTAQSYGISAATGGAAAPDRLVLSMAGPVANAATISYTSPGTETVTLSPSNGAFVGGAGPIIPLKNFKFSHRGVILNFWYGQPVNVGSNLAAAMAAQGAPVL